MLTEETQVEGDTVQDRIGLSLRYSCVATREAIKCMSLSTLRAGLPQDSHLVSLSGTAAAMIKDDPSPAEHKSL